MKTPVFIAAILLATATCQSADLPRSPADWPVYGADKLGSKYSPLMQINRSNFQRLKVAWRWNSPDNKIAATSDHKPGPNESTPIVVHGVLYTSTGFNQVAAINPQTGKTLWLYNPGSFGGVHRGVSYWESGNDRRILIATKDCYLICLNAANGKPILTFGTHGRVDLTKGLRRPVDRNIVAQTSPVMVLKNVVITGGAVDDFQDSMEMPPGDIRGFDVRTGKQLWVFHTIPQPGEFGNETWKNGSWKYTGAANCWSIMSADPELGYVYVPLGTPNNDWWAGHRPGDGLFGESLVCLNAQTGKRVWHFQMVHHGEWDYDLPCAPVLLNVRQNGKMVKAIAQVTKQAMCFVFDRVTGKPLWPIEEKPVPTSTMPGDTSSPTQPFPSKPKAFDRLGAFEDDLIDFTPELREDARQILAKYNHGPIFTVPSEQPTMEMPGWVGGASWAGAAGDPETGILYVPSITHPMMSSLKHPDNRKEGNVEWRLGESSGQIYGTKGLNLFKPPWGRITAINLNTGDHKWMVPNCDGPRNHPAIKHLKLGPLGWDRRNYCIVTKTLLITAQEGSWFNGEKPLFPATLRALDKATGKLVGEIPLPRHATGQPITYMVGKKQYVAIPTGGAQDPAELIVVALP